MMLNAPILSSINNRKQDLSLLNRMLNKQWKFICVYPRHPILEQYECMDSESHPIDVIGLIGQEVAHGMA